MIGAAPCFRFQPAPSFPDAPSSSSGEDAPCSCNWTPRTFGFRSGSTALAARPAADYSVGGMSISSCRTPSMSAGSLTRAKSMKASTRRSCPKSCGIKCSNAWAIILALRGPREHARLCACDQTCGAASCATRDS
jgi:hypothetical protein